jgi:hypothetical protein
VNGVPPIDGRLEVQTLRYPTIKKYLKAYSIHRSRISTIDGTFAAAVLPVGAYDAIKVVKAMKLLGQAQS